MISKIYQYLKGAARLFEALVKVLFFSDLHPQVNKLKIDTTKPAVILGNGPSLSSTLTSFPNFFAHKNIICVNDFAGSNYFVKLMPVLYIFTDPTYWMKSASKRIKNQIEQYKNKMINDVDWHMTIILPKAARKWNHFFEIPKKNMMISIYYINTTEVNCFRSFRYFLYKKNLAIPPMQNVIVAALFASINAGIKTTYLVGADHSWHESFFVGDDNILYLRNRRFQDKEEVTSSPFFQDPGESIPYRMDNLLFALAKMFRGYRELENYSKYMQAKIFNASTKSYIDAFERFHLPLK